MKIFRSSGQSALRVLQAGACLLAATSTLACDDVPPDRLDAFVRQGMRDWSVTGLSIAVVKDGRIDFLRGYGVRDARTNEPVDADTVFQIGSCSKPLTATALASLVDDGSLRWDTPVVRVWPTFRTADPTVTRQATLRDLLCHRTGVGRHEAVLYHEMPIGRAALLDRLREVSQAAAFRTEWRYSGLMYTVAGQMAARSTGKSWDDFMRRRLFEPLGMDRTVTSLAALGELDNVAVPHVRAGEKVDATKFADRDNVGPSASIASSASDLAKWLLLMTERGRAQDQRLLRPEVVDEMTTPQILMKAVDPVHGAHAFHAYGLGLMLLDYHGRRLAQHAGMAGHSMAMVGFVPEDRVGVAVLTNYRPSLFHYAVFRRAIDLYCGQEPLELDAANRKLFDEHFARLAQSVGERNAQRDPARRSTLPLQAYLGNFEGRYGWRVTIRAEADAIVLRYGNYVADVEHWRDDTFRARLRERRMPAEQDWYLHFTVVDGRVAKLHIHSEHDVDADFVSTLEER